MKRKSTSDQRSLAGTLSPKIVVARDDRFYPASEDPPQLHRLASERDRDRILYTNEFRRLAGITQVVAPDGLHPLHTRLTHVLEVSQVGRRLAQRLLRDQGPDDAKAVGGVDPEVVEAACMAHDLGHPPFGHVAEAELDQLADLKGLKEGFEGNAQSFRVITRLAFRRAGMVGLNLTRATLNATLKYPWFRSLHGKSRVKCGAYHSDRLAFNWARELMPTEKDDRKSAEAELMDFADDIAYSIHDAEDFYVAGKIPLDRLGTDQAEVGRFLDGAFARWEKDEQRVLSANEKQAAEAALRRLQIAFRLGVSRPFCGTTDQRTRLCEMASFLVGRFIQGIRLRPSRNDRLVEINPQIATEIKVMKELTWYYVINNAALVTQQYGQRQLIQGLFGIFWKVVTNEEKSPHLMPVSSLERLQQLNFLEDQRELGETEAKDERIRLVLDLISGMSEHQVIELHHRFTGVALGSGLLSIY